MPPAPGKVKTHTAHQHARKTTFTQHLRDAYNINHNRATRRQAAPAAAGIATATLLTLALQTTMTLTAAILTAAILTCISLISLAATGKMAKPGKWLPRAFKNMRGPLAPKRRIKHWYRHKIRRKPNPQ